MVALADACLYNYSWACILCVALLAVALLATPATGAGQALGIKHPVLKHDLNPARTADAEQAVARVMGMSEAEMLSFIPDRPFCRFCYCPHCHAGYPGDTFTWTVEKPDELRCLKCATTYPNARYPDDQVMTGPNVFGENFSYAFQVDKQTGIRIFLPAHLLMFRRNWIVQQCRALGVAYQLTQKPEYAYRAALILDRIAQVYPHYPVMDQWITTFYISKSQTPPYPYGGGKWGRWAEDELPAGLPEAYDLVYDSQEFDRLSLTRGYDVRERFERDFLKATFAYTDTFGAVINAGNMAPISLMVAVAMGKVINEPHYVHWAYNWLKEILFGGCFYDGMWKEAPSYHYQTISRVEANFRALQGYSDPPGFVDPKDGQHFQNLDPLAEAPFIATAVRAPQALDFPNGCSTPVHDTWPGERRSAARTKTVSTIRPGYGHASLGRGEGPHQMQAQMHFSGAYGHAHADNLNLTLWAKEREMLSDLGYSHTRVRSWNASTIAHNLVAIDRQSQNTAKSDGDLLWYFPDTAGVSVVEADGRRAYAKIGDLQTYRRLLVTIPVSAEDAYVVDLFRVKGGRTHDWLLHGDADRDMTATCSVALQPREGSMLEPGEEWVEPRDEQSNFNPYGVIRQVRQGQTADGMQVSFKYQDEPNRGLRLHLPGKAPMQVFLGQSPSVRRCKSDSSRVYDFWMPQLILRRQGESTLTSLFAAVEEPYSGKPFLSSVESLPLSPADGSAVALRITHGDCVDTLLSTQDSAPYPERVADGMRLRGRLGIVRHQGGTAIGAWLFEGEALAGEGFSVTSPDPAYTGTIEAAPRRAGGHAEDGFLTAATLPLGDTLKGSWMIVTHPDGHTHGYEIATVKRQGDRTLVVLTSDHGLEIEGDTTREVFFPRRTFTGQNTFRVSNAVGLVRSGSGLWRVKLGAPMDLALPR